jgi:hypothetical protein
LDDPINEYDDLGAFGFKRKDSANRYKQRSDLLFKILLFFGIILLISSIVLMAVSMNSSEIDYSGTANSVFSLSIIFLAFAVILYFFKRQFGKLAEIAEEIENSAEFSDEEVQ